MKVLVGLGDGYYSLGQYVKAIDVFEKSLVISKEQGDRAGQGATYNNLGSWPLFFSEVSYFFSYFFLKDLV
jgi:hypothetical protein